MSAKKQGPPRIPQPADTGRKSGWSTIYRPGAWFFHAGRLYVGYGRLSTFHPGEEPMWDPETVPVGAIVETCSGEYCFKKIIEEGPPYFRKYAVLSFRYYYCPDDFGWGFLKRKIDQGKFLLEEQVVVPSDCYLEYQWNVGACSLLARKGVGGYASGKNLERKILRAPSLRHTRFGKEVEEFRHKEHPHGCLRCGER